MIALFCMKAHEQSEKKVKPGVAELTGLYHFERPRRCVEVLVQLHEPDLNTLGVMVLCRKAPSTYCSVAVKHTVNKLNTDGN